MQSTISFQLSPDHQAVAVIDPTGYATLLRMSATEPRPRLQPAVQDYIERFAAIYGNDAEFVLFLIDAHRDQVRFNAIGGFNVTVDAPESGLGPISTLPGFPRLPNLRSYIYLARKDSLVLGPSLHELAHAWGVRLIEPTLLATQVINSDNHWGFSGVGGQLGGWRPGTLVDNGDGSFVITAGNVEPNGRSFNSVPYAPIELYLMGMAVPDDVPPLEVAINPVFGSLFEFRADGIAVVTIDQIIAGNGPRVPEATGTPRTLKATLVVLTDHALTDEEWQFYHDSMAWFSVAEDRDVNAVFNADTYPDAPIVNLLDQLGSEIGVKPINFFEATGGRALLEFIELEPTIGNP